MNVMSFIFIKRLLCFLIWLQLLLPAIGLSPKSADPAQRIGHFIVENPLILLTIDRVLLEYERGEGGTGPVMPRLLNEISVLNLNLPVDARIFNEALQQWLSSFLGKDFEEKPVFPKPEITPEFAAKDNFRIFILAESLHQFFKLPEKINESMIHCLSEPENVNYYRTQSFSRKLASCSPELLEKYLSFLMAFIVEHSVSLGLIQVEDKTSEVELAIPGSIVPLDLQLNENRFGAREKEYYQVEMSEPQVIEKFKKAFVSRFPDSSGDAELLLNFLYFPEKGVPTSLSVLDDGNLPPNEIPLILPFQNGRILELIPNVFPYFGKASLHFTLKAADHIPQAMDSLFMENILSILAMPCMEGFSATFNAKMAGVSVPERQHAHIFKHDLPFYGLRLEDPRIPVFRRSEGFSAGFIPKEVYPLPGVILESPDPKILAKEAFSLIQHLEEGFVPYNLYFKKENGIYRIYVLCRNDNQSPFLGRIAGALESGGNYILETPLPILKTYLEYKGKAYNLSSREMINAAAALFNQLSLSLANTLSIEKNMEFLLSNPEISSSGGKRNPLEAYWALKDPRMQTHVKGYVHNLMNLFLEHGFSLSQISHGLTLQDYMKMGLIIPELGAKLSADMEAIGLNHSMAWSILRGFLTRGALLNADPTRLSA